MHRYVALRGAQACLLCWVLGSVSLGTLAAAPKDTPRPPIEELTDYFLGPGDVLRISVWKEPELTTDVFVRLDGRVTVPLVGDVMAAGRTTDQLSMEVRTKLRAFLEVPQVTITLVQAVSARFYVIGEVATSGMFPLTGRTTVLQGLALAGGFREFAKRDRIMVIRERRSERIALPFNFNDVAGGARLEQNIALEAGDVIVVP